MTGIEIRRFEQADETRTFEHGSFEVVTIGAVLDTRITELSGMVIVKYSLISLEEI